ncbi:MAG: hypothetical protein K6E62_05560 [Lachnospiraceae bacterium]|nr:hypothetical protein [Lachnospiraceae bacterium]
MGEENNVLNGGIDILNEMKASVTGLEEMKQRVTELSEKQTKLEKDIAAKQKSMDAEIGTTVSKRLSEIEKSFDSEIDNTRDRMKRVRNKKDKLKDAKVSERIEMETASMRERIRSQKQDLKGIFSREHISRIFNTEYFFSVFLPDQVGDFCVILASIIIMLALPALIYILLPETLHKLWVGILLYVAVIVIAMAIFWLIYKFVKKKNLKALENARTIRDNIRNTKKDIRKLERDIRKDKDESGYGLEKYEYELQELDNQINDIIDQKKRALSDFENTTKVDISNQIKAGYIDSINKMKAENEIAYDEQRTLENRIKTTSLEISRKYEAYVGKENLSISMIDSLIEIINGGDAVNIADALVFYRKSQSDTRKPAAEKAVPETARPNDTNEPSNDSVGGSETDPADPV